MLSSLAFALLLVVTLTGVLPSVASSRGLVGVLADGAMEDHLLMMEKFHGWMAKHGRSYPTVEEKLRRFDIYHRNVMFIEAANLDGRLTYTLGENQFADLTHEEFLALHTSRRVAQPDLVRTEETVITTQAGVVTEANCQAAPDEVPDSINWADRGKVTKVKDQGHICGACWAFSAVATIESAYAIAKGGAPPVLSEQELIDCDELDDGCRIGLMSNAYQWVIRNGGIANASTYPYHERLQTPQNKEEKDGTCEEAKLREHAATIRNYKFVRRNCEQQLMAAVAARPVAVLFDPKNYCFRYYKSGVYNGMCIDDHGKLVGPCTSDHLSHSLTIVGYSGRGDDADKYWIAKNSWSKDGWGEHGYIRLKKDVADPRGLCGLAIQPVYPVV
ncbi:hypothetical protein ACQ4PT_049823 [Festuca glaucescens]